GRVTGGWAIARAPRAFKYAPAVVSTFGNPVNLFDDILSDVPGDEFARIAREREPPGVTQSVSVNLIAPWHSAEKWVVGGWRIRRRAVRGVHVYAEDFPQQFIGILGAVARVVCGTAITHADVEKSVGAELDHAAVVIGEGLSDGQNDLFTVHGNVGIGG